MNFPFPRHSPPKANIPSDAALADPNAPDATASEVLETTPTMPSIALQSLPQSLQDDVRFLSTLCTRIWRFERQLVRVAESDPSDNHDRLLRRFESIAEALREAHIEISDHDGQSYDSGLNLTVVQWEPREELKREMILETVKPSLRIRQLLIPGEVIVGQPIAPEAEIVNPEAEEISSDAEAVSPEEETVSPEEETVSPEADSPHLEATEANGEENA